MSERRDEPDPYSDADRDLVDEAGEESFPASDPPAWDPPGRQRRPPDED